MKKILHILISWSFSGAENVVCEIINMYKDNDQYEMAYCSPRGEIIEALEERKIKYIPMDGFTLQEIRRVTKEYNPDIIHTHDVKATLMTALLHKNIVSHIHGNHDDMKVASVKSIMYMIFNNRFKHIFWVSESAFEGYKYKKFLRNKSSILYNIIDNKKLKERMLKDNQCYEYDCIFIGRLCEIKNPMRMINIIDSVIEKYPTLKVAIIGDGILKDKVTSCVKEKKREANIDILGFKNNPLKILHDSRVMIMTSRYEGTPMCALEAMALGVPIVSTPTDGLKEIVEQNKTGILSDDDKQLMEAILNIVTDDDLWKKMNINSIIKSEEWNNKEKYIKSLNEIYDQFI